MAQTVQNVTLSLTLPITCHICLGKNEKRALNSGTRGKRYVSLSYAPTTMCFVPFASTCG
uniref:ORC ubiquitin ligase 1 n=1 Tax=Mus musculus TaxID=10090 RepID=A0A2I3BPV5_MOUSE